MGTTTRVHLFGFVYGRNHLRSDDLKNCFDVVDVFVFGFVLTAVCFGRGRCLINVIRSRCSDLGLENTKLFCPWRYWR